MGWLSTLFDGPVAALSTDPGGVPATIPADATPVAVAGDIAPNDLRTLDTRRAHRVAIDVALSIPSVRKARHVIAGTIGTLELHGWDGPRRLADDDPRVSWLVQPEARRSRFWTITRTVDDLIWHGRSVWRITDRHLYGAARVVERIHPDRIQTIEHPLDRETVETWIIDGREANPEQLIVHDAAGLGGLQQYGFEILELYGQLQAAAGRYAVAPHPHAILKNHGADLTDDEIDTLLDSWEAARGRRSIGYLNEVVDYDVIEGYSARELQLTEAREHSALEVARLFGLPSFSLDATPPGSSMTYANITDRRRDLLEALRPWMQAIESALSLDDRRGSRPRGLVLPHNIAARFDGDAYTRVDAKARMDTWKTAIESGVLTIDEARASEPLTRS